MGDNGATEWHAARALSFAAVSVLPAETVPLQEAIGRRVAHDIRALIDVPHYASSAMDGWAVAGRGPWRLREPAERTTPRELAAGEAVSVFTGSPVPFGTHGILRSEHGDVSASSGFLALNASARPGEPLRDQHVRPRAEEAAAGDLVMRSGTRLTPPHVAVLAACGHDSVEVRRRPRVRLVLTGSEVVRQGIPAPGFVRDSFGPQLPAVIDALGAVVVDSLHIADDLSQALAALSQVDDAENRFDMVVTTGGTGRSGADHLRESLHLLGADLLVEGVLMRPGGPSLLAQLPDGRLVVGLPGNPLAAMVGAQTLLQPAIAACLGAGLPPLLPVPLGATVRGTAGRVSVVPYRWEHGRAQPTGWRGSGMLRGLADADGVLVCPPGGAEIDQLVGSLPVSWPRQ